MSDLWTSPFGDDYTARNRNAALGSREALWEMLLPVDCASVLEVGANVGHNLVAISNINTCDLFACEPNAMARSELIATLDDLDQPPQHVTADRADKLSFGDGVADLAFTLGVLIHIPPDQLLASMREIHRCARRWIVCGEYFAPQQEMVPYHGHNDALWRRDYGSLWLDHFPDLHCQTCFFAWKRMTGLDNLTVWLFKKGAKRH